MDDDTKLALILIPCIFIVVFGVMGVLSNASCHAKWRGSEFVTSWGPLQGCLISKDRKVWIPAANYRDIP